MHQAEASGKTVEDALRKALAKLGATREEVEMTVLDEGKRGLLFGRGARDAVVRVERIPGARRQAAPPAAQGAETRMPRRGGRPERGGGGSGGGRARGPRRDRPERASGRRPLDMPAPKLTEADFLRGVERAESVAEPEDAAPVTRRRRDEERERPPREARKRDEPEVEPNIDAPEVDFAAGVVDDILRILDINAEISLREPMTPGDGRGAALAVIDVSGDDLGVLIGRRGETLMALQYLVNLVMGRRFPGQGGVTIDAEHYRVRREDQVVSLAARMAERVRETGDPITLEPMSAAERRLVHLSLADDPELETHSIGEGENRKVVISLRH